MSEDDKNKMKIYLACKELIVYLFIIVISSISGDFPPFSRGRISTQFPSKIANFPNNDVCFPQLKRKKKKKFFWGYFFKRPLLLRRNNDPCQNDT